MPNEDESLISVIAPDETIQFVNENFCNFYKYSTNEIIGQKHRILNSRFHPESFYENLWNAVLKGDSWAGQTKNKTKEGDDVWVQSTMTPVILDSKLKQIICVSTPLKDTNSQDKIKLQNLFNVQHALDKTSIVSITDKNGSITYVNNKFCEISKYTEEELVGKNHRILKSGYHTPLFYEEMWQKISTGKVWQGEIKNRAKDGSHYWEKMTIVPVLDLDANVKQHVSIKIDITEHKELSIDKLTKEKFETIGKLSSRIAHDIRNPLAIIRASVENLKILYEIDDVKLRNIEKIDRSINRIVHQIEDVLDFVRHDTLELSVGPFSEILADALDSIHIPNMVTLDLPRNDLELLCDNKKISIVLVNLIMNAIQAVKEKGTVKITLQELDQEIKIDVEDSGPGIPRAMMEKIFEPLYTTKQQGTGLGLSSVKNIVEAHSGTITIRSPPTVFSIHLPKNYFPQ